MVSHESRDRGHRLQRAHLGHCLAGDAHGAADHRIAPPMPPRGRPLGWRTGRVTPEAGMTVGKQEMKVAATRCDEGMRRDNGQLKSASLFGLGCGVTIVVAR